jgi:uncharacterized protein
MLITKSGMSEMKWLLLPLFIIILFSGCADTINQTDPDIDTPRVIKIIKPADNDSVGYRGSKIEYELNAISGMYFIELYVNDEFVLNFPPENNQNPVINFNIDSSFTGKSVEIYLIYYDKNGISYKSNTVKNVYVTKDRTLPSVPTGIQIIRIGISTVNISWQDNSPYVTGYEIWRREGESGEFVKHLTASPDARNINDENLDQSITYFYKIRTASENGISDFSSIVNTGGSGGSSSIPAPSNLIAEVSDLKVVKLSWKDNSTNENYFKIERRRDWAGYETIGYTEKNTENYTDSASQIDAGAEYFYRIKAVSDKDSSWSNEAYLFMPQYVLKKPEIISVNNYASRKVTITWQDKDQHYADFFIERKTGTGSFTERAVVSGYLNKFTDNVEPLKQYTYRIKQNDGFMNSAYSEETVIETQVIPLAVPENFNGYYDGYSMVLSWEYTADTDVFVVERKDSGSVFIEIGRTSGNNRDYRDNNTKCQQVYHYRIKAEDPYSVSGYSQEKEIKNWSFCP